MDTFSPFFNATLLSRQMVGQYSLIVRVRPDQRGIPDFKPGQFASLGLPTADIASPDLVRRSFSIASAPEEKSYLEFYISLIQQGVLTPRLWPLEEGDRLFLSPVITGTFTLDEIPVGKNLLLVATGTGLAPYVSMLRHYLARDQSPPWKQCAVIHGVRDATQLGYQNELSEFAGRGYLRLHYLPILSRPDETEFAHVSKWDGLVGRVQTLLQPGVLKQYTGWNMHPEDTHVMLCGNPNMVEESESLLRHFGFIRHKRKQPGNIHFEKYW